MHWATSYIGLPYAVGAQGPEYWDCWSFFRRIQMERFGREIPVLPSPPSWRHVAEAFPAWSTEYGWHSVAVPRDGDAVSMSRLREATHIGIWLGDLKSVLHCVEGSGSVLSDTRHLAAALWRVRGYYSPEA